MIADLDHVLTCEAIEPLVLLFVVVLRWTGAAPRDRLFRQEQRAVAVLRRHLDVQGVSTRQVDDLVETARASGHFGDRGI